MADTTIGGSLPLLVDVEISTSPSEITIPVGVYSVALLEAVTGLEVSYDETTWAVPASTAGLIVWQSRLGRGGTVHLKLTSGSASTHPLLAQDHL